VISSLLMVSRSKQPSAMALSSSLLAGMRSLPLGSLHPAPGLERGNVLFDSFYFSGPRFGS
jgi:hypothetical protein